MNMMQVGALVGELKCGVAIKGMGEEQENRRETERKEKRKKTEKDRTLPPQRNGRKEESRSRQDLSLKGPFCTCGQTRTLGTAWVHPAR